MPEYQQLINNFRAPSESQQKWWEHRIYRGFAWLRKNEGKTMGGRFWSISVDLCHNVYPLFTHSTMGG